MSDHHNDADHESLWGDPAELAALYIAGAMSDDERRTFEEHLTAGCAMCDGELQALDEVVASLARLVEPVEPSDVSRLITVATANHVLGAPSPEQVRGIADLVATVEGSLPEILAAARDWQPHAIPGLSVQTLEVDRPRRRVTALLHAEPGTSFPPHVHDDAEQCIVLHGDLTIGNERLTVGNYRYWKPGEPQPQQVTEEGCLLLVSSPID